VAGIKKPMPKKKKGSKYTDKIAKFSYCQTCPVRKLVKENDNKMKNK